VVPPLGEVVVHEVELAGRDVLALTGRVRERSSRRRPAVRATFDVVGPNRSAVGGHRVVVGEPAGVLEAGIGRIAKPKLDGLAGERREAGEVVQVLPARGPGQAYFLSP
jgi:hypothetical protein